MKKFISIILLALFFCNSYAQKIEIEEEREKIAGGTNDVLTVVIHGATKKNIEKAWKKILKGYNGKITSKKEIFADDAQIMSISSNTIDVYTKFEESNDGVKMIVGFDLGGAFLNSSQHSSKFKAAEKLIRDFAIDETKNAIKDKLEDEQKALKKMEKELDGLVRSNERLHSDIEKYEKLIEKAKQDIVTNEDDQKKSSSEIEDQKIVVESVEKNLSKIK